jgi:uncharacterized protein YndB with AHSA1/START domain
MQLSTLAGMKPSLRFAVTHVIPARNEDVWRVLEDFGAEHRWTTSVRWCTRDTADVRVGTVRTCQLPRPLMGRSEVREEVTELEPGRVLAYFLDGTAGPFATASSRWSTVTTAGDATAVTVQGTFAPKNAAVPVVVWPFAKPTLQRLTRHVLRELEVFLRSR